MSNEEAIEIVQNLIKLHLNNVPIGKIGIIPPKESTQYQKGQVYVGEKGDLRKYTYAYKKELDAWVKIGVIQCEEFYNYPSNKISLRGHEIRHDGNKYIVSLTEEGQKMIDTSKNIPEKEMFPLLTNKYFVINLAKSKVTSIVKNIEVKDQGKYGTKDIRLVMGTHEYFPTELGVKYFDHVGGVKDKERKFRTIMEYDPFKNKYKIIAFDAGIISTGRWLTNSVEE